MTIVGCVAASSSSLPNADAAERPLQLGVLQPGAVGGFVAPLPVNVVFVGYHQGRGAQQVDVDRFRDELAPVAVSLVMFPLLRGVVRETHIASLLDYRMHFAPAAFEDAFFGHLVASGEQRSLTASQQAYNQDPARSLDIADGLAIDAVATEKWLAEHAPAYLGIDTAQPTVFLVNWHGRADFRFHVYTKTGDPDADTAVDHGRFDSRALIAWGGTAADDKTDGDGVVRRVWFHDLSAGPDLTTRGGDLSNADVDGDGVADYRLPPVWEYGNVDGYRPFTDLTGDLAKIVRYVATNMLFAPSPIYNPVISAPAIPSTVSIDINRAASVVTPPPAIAHSAFVQRLTRLQPWTEFSTTTREHGMSNRLRSVHDCWLSAFFDARFIGESCYGERGGGFAYYDLFFYVYDQLLNLTADTADHSVPVLLFDFPDDAVIPLLGLAEGSPVDLEYSQSHIVQYTQPRLVQNGFGVTSTLTHEVGHHIGLAHPHDGVDVVEGVVYSPTADFHFAWTGDESSTTMSYLHVESDFSQFDQDAMGRWMTAGFLNEANALLTGVFESPLARTVEPRVLAADRAAREAVDAYMISDYVAAAMAAERAYDLVVAAALDLRVPVEPQASPADAKSRSMQAFFVDPVPPEFVDPTVLRPTTRRFAPLESPPESPNGPWVRWASG